MKRAILLILLFASAFAITFSVEHEGTLFIGEDNEYVIHVGNSINDSPVPNATIQLYKGSDLLAQELTDSNGSASFILHPLNETTLAFRVMKMGYNEYILFEKTVVRPVIVNDIIPTNITEETNNTSAAITGYLTLNPGDQGIFFFIMFFVFVSLFAGSYLYYKNFAIQSPEEELSEMEGTSWEVTNAFDFSFSKDPFDGFGNALDKLNSL